MWKQLLALLAVLCILFSSHSALYARGRGSHLVLVITVDSEVTAATEAMLKDALSLAVKREAGLLVVKLNTPGGEVGAVRGIMDLLESSEIPICVFVYPPGGCAWSGGTYILMASHVAVMASGTTIGSCQPALPTGEPVNASKHVNAYASLMVDHARLHGRNETAARLFVTENLNLGPEEALRNHVIELVSDDVYNLLGKLEAYTLIRCKTETGTRVWRVVPNNQTENYEPEQKTAFIDLTEAAVEEYEPGVQIKIYRLLLNPLVSSLLLIIGIFSLMIGIKTPGYGAEIAGGVCIFLALIALGAIGITPGAIVLFAVGVLLILAEIKTNIGVLALSGVVCLTLGSLLLFPSPQWLLYYQVSQQIRWFLVGVSVFIASFFGLLVYKVAEAKHQKVITGGEALIGAQGVAATTIEARGEARVLGEFWQAKTEGRPIREGEKLEVVRREGLVLVVKPSEEKV